MLICSIFFKALTGFFGFSVVLYFWSWHHWSSVDGIFLITMCLAGNELKGRRTNINSLSMCPLRNSNACLLAFWKKCLCLNMEQYLTCPLEIWFFHCCSFGSGEGTCKKEMYMQWFLRFSESISCWQLLELNWPFVLLKQLYFYDLSRSLFFHATVNIFLRTKMWMWKQIQVLLQVLIILCRFIDTVSSVDHFLSDLSPLI